MEVSTIIKKIFLLTACVVIILLLSFSLPTFRRQIRHAETHFQKEIRHAETHLTKTIFGATELWEGVKWSDILNFEGCEYDNCVCENSSTLDDAKYADVVVFMDAMWTHNFPNVSSITREEQLWIFACMEAGVIPQHYLQPNLNNKFNAIMMHRRDANISYPYGKKKTLNSSLARTNFAAGKTKGAFAYISNCGAQTYDRIAVMEEISKYIPVDIFSSGCRGPHVRKPPCLRLPTGPNTACEEEHNKAYRFYLSFENALCLDYVSEKFWNRLKSSSIFLPIALGGFSVEDYTRIAPLNSFLHVYNFSSIAKLGEHLKYLMENDEAYNRYHEWRYEYYIDTDLNLAACDLCKIANERPSLPVINNIVDWMKDPSICRSYNIT